MSNPAPTPAASGGAGPQGTPTRPQQRPAGPSAGGPRPSAGGPLQRAPSGGPQPALQRPMSSGGPTPTNRPGSLPPGQPMRPQAPPAGTPTTGRPSMSPMPVERIIEMEDDIPLVAEVYENQRYYPVVKWSAKLMDRPAWSNEDGTKEQSMDDFKVPPGWTWAGEWQIEINDGPNGNTDAEGWSYATDFTRRYHGSADSSLKAVRRRRHIRRRIPPAKSVKQALGLAGGPNSNSLTVGLVKNTLAVNGYSVRSANGFSLMASSNTVSGRPKAAGTGVSLAELYAKQTVDPPPAAAAPGAAVSPAGTNTTNPSMTVTVTGDGQSTANDSASRDLSSPSSVASSASSTLTASGAAALSAGLEGMQLSPTLVDSPSMKPKYTPFSSLSFSGLDPSFTEKVKPAKAMVQLWEYQRYYPIAGWSSRMLPTDNKGKGPWINNADHSRCDPKETFQLSAEWTWTMDQWAPLIDASTDLEGWSYAIEPTLQYHPRKGMEHFVRRRMWQREKQQLLKQNNARGGVGGSSGPNTKKSYLAFFERLEYFKKDLLEEEKDDDLFATNSINWW